MNAATIELTSLLRRDGSEINVPCDGCGKTLAGHDRLLRCVGPNARVKAAAEGRPA